MSTLPGQSFAELVFDTSGLRKMKAQVVNAVLIEMKETLVEQSRKMEKEFEAATAAAGLGKLAKAWKSATYPRGARTAYDPAADVFVNGSKTTLHASLAGDFRNDRSRGAMTAALNGAVIHNRSGGKYLCIPQKAAGARFIGRAKEPITPKLWEQRTGLKLRMIKERGKLFLVTDGVTGKKTGVVARAATQRRLANGKKTETLFIFRLLPMVRLHSRLNVRGIRSNYQTSLPEVFQRRLNYRLTFQNSEG